VGDYDALRAAERRRLERFAEQFDLVDAAEYGMLAIDSLPPERAMAAEAAAWSSVRGQRAAAIRAAVGAFQASIEQAYARRLPIPYVPNVIMPLVSTRPEDRERVMDSIRRAILAVALWDTLEPEDRAILIGGWATLTDRAGFES
jgi:hypothetical protein